MKQHGDWDKALHVFCEKKFAWLHTFHHCQKNSWNVSAKLGSTPWMRNEIKKDNRTHHRCDYFHPACSYFLLRKNSTGPNRDFQRNSIDAVTKRHLGNWDNRKGAQSRIGSERPIKGTSRLRTMLEEDILGVVSPASVPFLKEWKTKVRNGKKNQSNKSKSEKKRTKKTLTKKTNTQKQTHKNKQKNKHTKTNAQKQTHKNKHTKTNTHTKKWVKGGLK